MSVYREGSLSAFADGCDSQFVRKTTSYWLARRASTPCLTLRVPELHFLSTAHSLTTEHPNLAPPVVSIFLAAPITSRAAFLFYRSLFLFARRSLYQAMSEVEETLKRINSHKGVVGIVIANHEGAPIRSTLETAVAEQMSSQLLGSPPRRARPCATSTRRTT